MFDLARRRHQIGIVLAVLPIRDFLQFFVCQTVVDLLAPGIRQIYVFHK